MYLFWIFHINGIIQYVTFRVWLLSLDVFEVHPCCSIYQYFIAFYGWIIFHCMYIPQLFIHSSVDGLLGCFHLLAIVNSSAMIIHVQVFVWVPVFTSFRYITRSRTSGSMINLLRKHQTVFHSSWPFYIPTSNKQGFQFLHILTNTHYFPFCWLWPSLWMWSGISLWFWFVFP